MAKYIPRSETAPKPPRRKSPQRDKDERRIRKEIRTLLREYEHKQISKDEFVRGLYELVDDERRRAFMSMAPVGVQAIAAYDAISQSLAHGG